MQNLCKFNVAPKSVQNLCKLLRRKLCLYYFLLPGFVAFKGGVNQFSV